MQETINKKTTPRVHPTPITFNALFGSKPCNKVNSIVASKKFVTEGSTHKAISIKKVKYGRIFLYRRM